jgi:non-specific protein-tyrosine kinase
LASGKPDIVVARSPGSSASEAYRFLRVAVRSAASARPLKSILVASAGGESGGAAQATLVANLAAAFAIDGLDVLLVDADLRRPSLHDLFALDSSRGLTSYLEEADDATPPLQASGVERLHVLAAGPRPARPAELLGSPRMARVLARLGEAADLVIFDAAPVLMAADAAVLARQVDGCLLVVWEGKTRRGDGVRAKQLLERAGANLLGVVIGVS